MVAASRVAQMEIEPEFFIDSPAMASIATRAKKLARIDETLLILGETGTGKDALARFIHYNSPRMANPIVFLASGNVNDSLFESEFFGHVRGAFTDAKTAHRGQIEQAAGGTLVVDDIDALSMVQQHKFLHFLDRKEILPIGGIRKRIDIRILVTSNQNLTQLVRRGQFREDLYYRVASLNLEIPPLRTRPDDAVALFQHFASCRSNTNERGACKTSIDSEAASFVRTYPWPGNVRQLERVARACSQLADGPISVIDIKQFLGPTEPPLLKPYSDLDSMSLEAHLDHVREDVILRVLNDEAGNILSTSRRLRISRNLIYSVLRRRSDRQN